MYLVRKSRTIKTGQGDLELIKGKTMSGIPKDIAQELLSRREIQRVDPPSGCTKGTGNCPEGVLKYHPGAKAQRLFCTPWQEWCYKERKENM